MMTLLIPLGLLGLLSIIGLILIYIIKPNYQQKVISSTFVWKLSLKYKKRRLPVSKLRNILLIICQVLILVACALILARPSVVYNTTVAKDEVIAVIDSSASMYAKVDGVTRFERAIDMVKDNAETVLLRGGEFTVVLADDDSTILCERVKRENSYALTAALDELSGANGDIACSYGSSDMSKAMEVCADLISVNPSAKVYVYTDTAYSYVPDGVQVVPVNRDSEWNASIINAYAELDEGYYTVFVEIACYGRSDSIDVSVNVNGANKDDTIEGDSGSSFTFTQSVYCVDGSIYTIVFRSGNKELEDYENEAENIIFSDISTDERFFSYGSILIMFDDTVSDSLALDNQYEIYGGVKKPLKVQYVSNQNNRFMPAVLGAVKNGLASEWDMQITEVKSGTPALHGYDFYFFEHVMPEEMPTDGVVLLFDIEGDAPKDSGVRLNGDVSYTSSYLMKEIDHPLLTNVAVDDVTVSRINYLTVLDTSYEVLASCDNQPVMLVKDDGTSKVVIFAFSIHYSNFALTKDFPLAFLNIFRYFFPETVSSNSAVVGEKIVLNALGDELLCKKSVSSTSEQVWRFDTFPAVTSFDTPGAYTFTQTTDFGKDLYDSVYVHIPRPECEITRTEDELENPYLSRAETEKIDDLLLWFAIALVSLLFIEWLLQARENF